MLVGKSCYVIENFNESKFKNLLELQLGYGKGEEISELFLEESIAALLEFKDSHPDVSNINANRMENLLKELGISYFDFRSYSYSPASGNAEDAIKAFNKIATDKIGAI